MVVVVMVMMVVVVMVMMVVMVMVVVMVITAAGQSLVNHLSLHLMLTTTTLRSQSLLLPHSSSLGQIPSCLPPPYPHPV